MAGTKQGGLKARNTNKKRHGDCFYREIGAMGGKVETSKPKGFAANRELARIAGTRGGQISRRNGKPVYSIKATEPEVSERTFKFKPLRTRLERIMHKGK